MGGGSEVVELLGGGSEVVELLGGGSEVVELLLDGGRVVLLLGGGVVPPPLGLGVTEGSGVAVAETVGLSVGVGPPPSIFHSGADVRSCTG